MEFLITPNHHFLSRKEKHTRKETMKHTKTTPNLYPTMWDKLHESFSPLCPIKCQFIFYSNKLRSFFIHFN